MTPASVRAWIRIVRDIAIVCVATFIAIHETVSSGDPNFYLLGFSATLFGIPAFLRLDERRLHNGEEGSDG